MEEQMIPIGIDETFNFSCHGKVPCFNACCRDLNQFLYPYDILRLKNHLGIVSGEFLEKYTIRHVGPETGLPVITLKASTADGLKCPFVSPEGCSVYENRPSSCRIYPLARAISLSRETGRVAEHFAVIRETHCRGFENGQSRTVREWLQDQGLAEYNQLNDMLMDIISLKNQLAPEPLDLTSRHLFHTALYDLDQFRAGIFKNELLKDFPLEDAVRAEIKKDDVALLKAGYKWIKHVLFER